MITGEVIIGANVLKDFMAGLKCRYLVILNAICLSYKVT